MVGASELSVVNRALVRVIGLTAATASIDAIVAASWGLMPPGPVTTRSALVPLSDWCSAAAVTVLWLNSCTAPIAIANASGVIAAARRRPWALRLAAANTGPAEPVRSIGPETTRMAPETRAGPRRARAMTRSTADPPAPAIAAGPGMKAGRVAVTSPLTPTDSPRINRVRLSFSGSTADSRSASMGSRRAGRRAETAAASRAVATAAATATRAGTGP